MGPDWSVFGDQISPNAYLVNFWAILKNVTFKLKPNLATFSNVWKIRGTFYFVYFWSHWLPPV